MDEDLNLDVIENLYAFRGKTHAKCKTVYHIVLEKDLHSAMAEHNIGHLHKEDFRGETLAVFGEDVESAESMMLPSLCRFEDEGKYVIEFRDYMLPAICKLCAKTLRLLVEQGAEGYIKHDLVKMQEHFERMHGLEDN